MIRDIVSASQWTATDICMEDYPVFYIPKKNPTFPQISALGSPNFTQRPLSTCAWSPEGFGGGSCTPGKHVGSTALPDAGLSPELQLNIPLNSVPSGAL